MPSEIPTSIIRTLYYEFEAEYGPTFPLYGSETKRHDISGSIRPLLSSTEIPHEKILAERTGISKKSIAKIISGETEFISFETADKLVSAMDKTHEWYDRLEAFYE